MICHNRKIVFIHIPRTAGLSIEHYLFPDYDFNDKRNKTLMYGWDKKSGWLNHLTCNEIRMNGYLSESKYNEYFKFAFVRNPWERLVSEYAWKFGNDFKKFRQFCIDIFEGNYKIWNVYYRESLAFIQHIKPQYKFIYNDSGSMEIDFCGRYENLEMDFRQICQMTGLKYKRLPFYNKSVHMYYTNYYDQYTREL
jgi:hypothetical protein